MSGGRVALQALVAKVASVTPFFPTFPHNTPQVAFLNTFHPIYSFSPVESYLLISITKIHYSSKYPIAALSNSMSSLNPPSAVLHLPQRSPLTLLLS